MIRLLLVDDQVLFRQGLATLLSTEDDFSVIGQADDGEEAIALAAQLEPDVILMDVQMPVCNGVVATREILQRFPWIRILVLTTFDDDEFVWQSLQAGALGYLLKHTPAEQFIASIRAVHLGYGQLSPTIAPKIFAHLKPLSSPNLDHQQLLSKREQEILKLIGQGKNNQEITRLLYLSEGTVKNYVTRILNRLGVRDRVQAALWAQQNLLD